MAKIKIGIMNWFRQNRLEALLLAAILLIGAFLRLYKIDQYMTFLGDEGRDVIVVRRLLVNFDPILIGPGTSIGNMYLGPIYYYMMAPFLLLFGFSPVGPAVMIAVLGVLTIFFVWLFTRELFGESKAGMGGLVAAGLYALSPIVINYSRSSWNPNIMPFFALMSIYAIWKVWSPNAKATEGQVLRKNYKWQVVTGVSMAFVLQSHYLGLLLIPVVGVFWGLSLLSIRDKREETKNFISLSLISSCLFLLLMSPLVIFDARHDWRNFEAMRTFFTQRQATVSARPWTSFPKIWPLFEKVNTRLVTGTNEAAGIIITLFLLTGVIVTLYKVLSKEVKGKNLSAYFLIFVWLGVALVGLGVYKQEIYDHYFGFFFAAPFIFLGGLVQEIYKRTNIYGRVVVLIFVLWLATMNLKESPLKHPPARQLQRSGEVAAKMVEESKADIFNIAVIAERNYEGAYQYFLEKENANFVIIDPQRADETITEQLFVVCELPKEKCDPTHNPKAEVANFGWSEIESEWRVSGVVLYKLVHTQ